MSTQPPLILLVGNPNSGKTTLFNSLTGLFARVGNYPGITVEHQEGTAQLDEKTVRILDLPGTYSLQPRSDDETIAVGGVFGLLPKTPPADIIVAVVDATALERNLYLVSQLRELPLPLVVALTMTDVLERDGRSLDVELLSSRLGIPVVPAPARRHGADKLRALLASYLEKPPARSPLLPPEVLGVETSVARDLGERLIPKLEGADLSLEGAQESLGLLALSARAADTVEKLPFPEEVRTYIAEQPEQSMDALVQARFARVSSFAEGVVGAPEEGGEASSERFTRYLDMLTLHPLLGPLILALLFFGLFMALFSWSTPLMDFIDETMGALGKSSAALVPENLPLLRSLVQDGIFAGVGNVIIFVPQIAVLFLFLALLEDSGYLARAAFLLDRLMAKIGLHGRAFVPLLSGFACAVPAIMATRTIESTKDRLVTIMVTPMISCSARLPVYALMIATVFQTQAPLFGFVPAGAVVMVSMYALSLLMTLLAASVLKRTLFKSPIPPLVLELPPYRLPKAKQVTRAVLSRVRLFLVEAGTIIAAITVVIWVLFTFPQNQELEAERLSQHAAENLPEGEARDAILAEIDAKAVEAQMEQSIAGRLGHAIEPVIAPLGFDWKLGVGIIASFAAREVLVSTLGVVYGLGDGADEESVSLRDAMRADRHKDGSPIYTPLTALSLLVFFVLAMQCMSTLAVVKRETRSWRWPLFQFGYMTVLAYGSSLLVYQVGQLLGFS